MGFLSPDIPDPKKPPPPPSPPVRADASRQAGAQRQDRPTGVTSLINTSPQGLATRARTQGRTLLGGGSQSNG